MRNVRQMVNRVAKHGYVAEVRRVSDIPKRELDGIVKEGSFNLDQGVGVRVVADRFGKALVTAHDAPQSIEHADVLRLLAG